MTLPHFPEYEELPEEVRVVYDEIKRACSRCRKDTGHDMLHHCTISVQDPGVTYNETDDQMVSLYTSVPCFLPDRERVGALQQEMKLLVSNNPRLTTGPFNGPACDGIREEIHILYRLADLPESEPEIRVPVFEPLPEFDFGFETT